MRREITFAVTKCAVPECRRDEAPGYGGHCTKHGQAINRRILKGDFTREQLVARGKWRPSEIDRYLAS